jgi:dihydroxyacid dehydratase/phosphogluconate dehydratase
VVIAAGGSTNAVLHLLAIAHVPRMRLTLDDFTRIGKRVPVLADLRPSGRYSMSELIRIGGIQPLMKRLLDHGLLHGDCLTVTGRTWRRTSPRVADTRPGRTSSARSRILSRRTAIWLCSMEISRRTGPWRRSPARKACGSKGERACSTARKEPPRRSSTAWSRPATSS